MLERSEILLRAFIMNTTVIGVILAAGHGTRMAPFSSRYPKVLLPICNKPLIVHQIEQMVRLGIKDVLIVIGHLGQEVVRTVGDGVRYGLRITYVEQTRRMGIAHAVAQLEESVKGPFLMFLGDVFFDAPDLTLMISDFFNRSAAAVIAVKRELNRDSTWRNFSVVLGEERIVTRVAEKSRYTGTQFKGCGLYLFDLPIFDAIRRTPRTALRDEYEITDSIQLLIEAGGLVTAAEVILDDVNVTYPRDLLECNLIQLRKLKRERLIAESVVLHKGTRVKASVLGEGVKVSEPIFILNSVIFDGSDISSGTDLDRAIVTPEGVVDCRNTA